jgi:NTE family protein
VNQRLESFEVTDETWKPNLDATNRSEELVLILAFSGGGTRAAALSYGVLEALDEIEVPAPGHIGNVVSAEGSHTLLDEIDAITSVSGGSFTSAYYGLHGRDMFDDFKEKFLYHNVQRALAARLLLPSNWVRLASPTFGRSEMAEEYYDKLLFQGATFGDLLTRNSPALLIQATDVVDGIHFAFTPYYFALICSDLAEFPLSRAVTASSAFPGAFSTVRLHNYAGTCGFEEEEWITEALEKEDLWSRTFHTASHLHTYHDPEKKKYIQLMDGGISDNIGLRNPLGVMAARGEVRQTLEDLGIDEARRVVFIVVNAEGKSSNPWGVTNVGPTLGAMLNVLSSIMISSYNYETMELLESYIEKWSAENRNLDKGELPIEFYAINVGFRAIRDEDERKYFQNIPTSFGLQRNSVDDLREVARKILYASPQLQKLVSDLGGAIPSSESKE